MNEVIFDIETQNSFADVDNDFKRLRISVVSVYRYDTGKFESFAENELCRLWPVFEKSDCLIGYNSVHFDIPILNNYYPGDLSTFPHLDLLVKIKQSLGFRLKLKDVAEATLDGVNKSADGLQALRWWKEGRIDEIKRYCEQDVRVTRDVFEFGRKNKQLFYKLLSGEIAPFAVDFSLPSVASKTAPTGGVNLTLPI